MKVVISVLSLLLAAGPLAAATPDYPNRPLRIVLPNAPGSTTDTLGRIVFIRMAEALGRPIVVDNRPGAGGTLGMDIAARAAPDGYTLVAVAASMLTITPHVYRKLSYDALRDFAPVSTFVLAQTALCVHANLPAKTVREFVQLATARGTSLHMASAGVGSTSHLGGVLFATQAGLAPQHVPYKGGGPSIAAVAQGEAQWTVPPLSAAMPHVRAGRIRCLATGGDQRSPVTPELPTIAESGVPGFRFYGWNGVVVPRATPRAAIERLNGVMKEVLERPDVRKLYWEAGEVPAYSTPHAFGTLIREDFDAMGRLVKLAGISAE
jgi:tripartite-type tricarboxylate transporter receptor subunit TctC